ncbi:MAG: 3-isopropylmalate dehydrogenase [Candidatus Diapherotrites archaeon]|uniref:3-isopropylmalate dehydrogenase n=1 Tax=Candidatus Iainarchaeum sp. TaxID=3101447 RepID=A0A938YYF3_9ARCH|nr:3-isopropylmalate dehydrogenase [Candidatus Diapherotrites archaeon]
MARKFKVAVLPGDGIGPEIMEQALKALDAVGEKFSHEFEATEALFGGIAIDKTGEPLPKETIEICKQSDAILGGAVGGPKWDHVEQNLRPEAGLLALRKQFGLFANLRPVKLYPALIDNSTLKKEVIGGMDIMIVRELTGGIYFGQPKGIMESGTKGINTMVYTVEEVERVAKVAFEIALKRKKKLCSVDKSNVLEVSRLWRNTVEKLAKQFPEVELSHLYVDNAAMQLVRNPRQFDVIVTGNMFGDILSDEASMLSGSLGMLPSAAIGGKIGFFEPVHGSAPDIAGQGKANPCAMVCSVGMMLKYAFDLNEGHKAVDNAVSTALAKGFRCADIAKPGEKTVGTREMGQAILKEI